MPRSPARGCDLTTQRHIGVHFRATSEEAAEAVARELRNNGWDPRILALGDEWAVARLGKRIVVSATSIAGVRQWSEHFASRLGVTYHGWQASLDPGLDVT